MAAPAAGRAEREKHSFPYLQSAYMQKALHERIPNLLRVLAHLAGLFVGSAPFEHLQHLPGNFDKWFCLEADGANSLELADFALKIVDTWFAGICLQFLKAGDDARLGHEQQIVHVNADIRRNCRSNAPVNILKKIRSVRPERPEAHHHRESGLNLAVAIVAWNTVYLECAVASLSVPGKEIGTGLMAHLSPLGWEFGYEQWTMHRN